MYLAKSHLQPEKQLIWTLTSLVVSSWLAGWTLPLGSVFRLGTLWGQVFVGECNVTELLQEAKEKDLLNLGLRDGLRGCITRVSGAGEWLLARHL